MEALSPLEVQPAAGALDAYRPRSWPHPLNLMKISRMTQQMTRNSAMGAAMESAMTSAIGLIIHRMPAGRRFSERRSAVGHLANQTLDRYDSRIDTLGGVDLKRRIFIAATAATGGAACSRARKPAPGYRVLTEAEVGVLDAWCEALIPAGDVPGASWARVPRYIDIQLTRKFRGLLPRYRKALAAMADWSRRADVPAMTARLERMEKGQAPRDLFPDGGRDAFEMVLAHTMQGFYGSPRHGGNRDYVSWTMLGVPPMPVRGREHYEIETPEGRS